MLVSEAVNKDYKEQLLNEEKRPSTIRGYMCDLNFWVKYLEECLNGPALMEDLDSGSITQFLLMLKEERGYKPSSRKRLAMSIKMFLRFAYKARLIEENLAEDVPVIKCPQQERDFLSEEEVLTFMRAVDHDVVRVAIATMFYAGLRVSEVTKLMVGDVDMKEGLLCINDAKGGKSRIVPLSPKLRVILEDYLEWKVDSPWFFATAKTGKVSSVRISSVIRETREKLGWDNHVTPHTFRHSFASSLAAKDVNVVSISKLMGHSDIKTTSIYLHADQSQLVEAVNAL